jgi:hypothetical protein
MKTQNDDPDDIGQLQMTTQITNKMTTPYDNPDGYLHEIQITAKMTTQIKTRKTTPSNLEDIPDGIPDSNPDENI